jgi:hypothetical protein
MVRRRKEADEQARGKRLARMKRDLETYATRKPAGTVAAALAQP